MLGGRFIVLMLICCVPVQENFAQAICRLSSNLIKQSPDDQAPAPISKLPGLPEAEEIKRHHSDADEAFGLSAAFIVLDPFLLPALSHAAFDHHSTSTVLLKTLHRLRI